MNGRETSPLADLQLGVRELFRILVPGAYALAVVYLTNPGQQLVLLASRSNAAGLGIILLLGLIGYALRIHERWWPYYRVFEAHRRELNTSIRNITGAAEGDDYVDLYKYFLETAGSEISARVHYFSSFYYMLVELSLISFLTAFIPGLAWGLQSVAASGATYCLLIVGVLVSTAVVFQTYLLRGLSGIREPAESRIAFVPAILFLLAICFASYPSLRAVRSLRGLNWFSLVQPMLFLVLALAFERLAAKQWRAIIREQIWLVQDKAWELSRLWDRRHHDETAGI